MYGFCNLSVVPCRAEASDKSEMTSQLLFGDFFEVLEKEGAWHKIKIDYDGYECWVDEKQYMLISKETYEKLQSAPMVCSNELIQVLSNTSHENIFPVVLGSSMPFISNGEFAVEDNSFALDGDIITGELPYKKEGLVNTALQYLNAPYLWGGKSPLGIDCSGLTQLVYKLNGIKLPRDAWQQAEIGETLSFVEEAEPGDLAFFDNKEGHIVHVGVVMQDNKIIHASGKVRIDSFDHQGIFKSDTNTYSHTLRLLKRIV